MTSDLGSVSLQRFAGTDLPDIPRCPRELGTSRWQFSQDAAIADAMVFCRQDRHCAFNSNRWMFAENNSAYSLTRKRQNRGILCLSAALYAWVT
jgi:hypothetical protein